MATPPLVWHYGLMAQRWAEFISGTPQLPFLRAAIARFGQPVLDLCCGTGRLLLPLLRDGIDIDGCDISADMLGHCNQNAATIGMKPGLFQQPMHSMELPRKYRTIYICDSFGLAGGRDEDMSTLRRCRAHLEVGGALIVNIEAEYTSAESWKTWLAETRATLPEPWPAEGRRSVAADGTEHVARFRLVSLDPLEQSYVREVRLEKWRDGALAGSEEYALRGNMYFKNELMLMLQLAGFAEIIVQGNWEAAPATPESRQLVFTAIR